MAKRLLVFLKRPGDQLQFNSFLAAQAQPTKFAALLVLFILSVSFRRPTDVFGGHDDQGVVDEPYLGEAVRVVLISSPT